MMVQKMLKLEYHENILNNFRRTLEMPLINYEINLILTWSVRYFTIDGTKNLCSSCKSINSR